MTPWPTTSLFLQALGLVGATLIVWVVNLVLDFVPGPWQVAGRRGRRNRRRRGE